MRVTVWVIQGVLALIFLSSGIAKSLMSREKMLATGQTGAAALPLGLVRFVAVCEIVGAVGLILPVWLSIDTSLTAWAAIGLAIVMSGAAILHFRIHELRPIVVNLFILGLCIVVACERR